MLNCSCIPVRTLPLVAALLLLPSIARSNGPAYTCDEGGYVLRLGVAWLSAEHEFGLDGRRHDLFDDTLRFRDAKFGQTDVSFQGEFGVTDWLTGVAQTQLRTVVREAFYVPTGRDTTISASGLTDLWLSARVRLLPLDSRYRATATLAWKAPMGSPTQEIPLGTGVPDYAVGSAASAPYEIGAVTGSLQLSGDFRFRNKASNEIAYAGQLDVNVGRGFVVRGLFDGIHSLADFDRAQTDPTAVNRTVVGDRSYSRWSVGFLLEADEGLELGATFSDQFGGRNALMATSFALNATWRTTK